MESRAYVTIYESVVRPTLCASCPGTGVRRSATRMRGHWPASSIRRMAPFSTGGGTGRWTRAIAERFRARSDHRLDLSFAMCRRAAPSASRRALREGHRRKLPFATRAGAINCWAAAAVPHPERRWRGGALSSARREPGPVSPSASRRPSIGIQGTHARLPSFRDENPSMGFPTTDGRGRPERPELRCSSPHDEEMGAAETAGVAAGCLR